MSETTSNAQRTRQIADPRGRQIATLAAGTIMVLEFWDAFHISHPVGAILAIVLFGAGIGWLHAKRTRPAALYLAVLFSLEIIGNVTVFGVLDDLRHRGTWTDFATGVGYAAANVVGLIACLAIAVRPATSDYRPTHI